jgi:maltooligosyltrehalose trehalohydrolase
MLELYRELISMRRTIPGITDPDFRHLTASADEEARWFRFGRPGVEILVDFSTRGVRLPVPSGWRVVSKTDAAAHVADGFAIVPPRSAVVITGPGE